MSLPEHLSIPGHLGSLQLLEAIVEVSERILGRERDLPAQGVHFGDLLRLEVDLTVLILALWGVNEPCPVEFVAGLALRLTPLRVKVVRAFAEVSGERAPGFFADPDVRQVRVGERRLDPREKVLLIKHARSLADQLAGRRVDT